MVDLRRPLLPVPFLLAALALSAPAATAGAVGDPGGVVKVLGLPDLPVGPSGDVVRWTAHDGHADVEGAGMQVQMEAGCSLGLDATRSSCSGFVCLKDTGSGDLPVSLGAPGQGMYGVGVDLSGLLGGGGPDASGEGAEYGPYQGAFVDTEGHCGP